SAAEKLRVLTPRETLRQYGQRLNHARSRLDLLATHGVRGCRNRLCGASEQLALLSPRSTLQRGYSITRRADDGRLVKSVRLVKPGEKVNTIVADGEFVAGVE